MCRLQLHHSGASRPARRRGGRDRYPESPALWPRRTLSVLAGHASSRASRCILGRLLRPGQLACSPRPVLTALMDAVGRGEIASLVIVQQDRLVRFFPWFEHLCAQRGTDIPVQNAETLSHKALRWFATGGKPSAAALKLPWNAIRHDQFPWSLEVTKCSGAQAILDLGGAFERSPLQMRR